MAEQSYSGLGYGHEYSHQHAPTATAATATCKNSNYNTGTNGSGPSNAYNVDDLMSSYMQQCLQYHEEQIQSDNQNPGGRDVVYNGDGDDHGDQQEHANFSEVSTGPLHFVPAAENEIVVPLHVEQGTGKQFITGNDHANSVNTTDTSSNANDTTPNPTQTRNVANNPEFQKALERAKAIAKRIATGVDIGSVTAPVDHSTSKNKNTTDPYPYAQKRHEFLTKHHAKLRSFLLQNFEYLAERDEAQLQRQLHHLNSFSQQYQQQEQLMKQKQQDKLQSRKRKQLQSVAGIGSHQRRSINSSDVNGIASTPSCGIYITGLPIDDEQVTNTGGGDHKLHQTDHQTDEELTETIKMLFASFGKVSSVKFYMTKTKTKSMTQGQGQVKRKGDGLVLFDWSCVRKDVQMKMDLDMVETDNISSFLETVCQQVSRIDYFDYFIPWQSMFMHLYYVIKWDDFVKHSC